MKKNKLQRKIKRHKKRIFLKIKKHKVKVFITTLIILFFIWLKVSYNIYINNEKNIINTVYFDKYIIDNNQLSWVTNKIEETFIGVNSVKNKILWYEQEKNNIYKKYNYIDKIYLNLIDNSTVKVWLEFKKTKLNFIWSWKIYWVYNENHIEQFNINNISWLNLLNTWANNLYIPEYLYNKNIDKIFFKTSLEKLITYTEKLKKIFTKWKIYYLAGWESIKIESDNKIYFFSLEKDIDKQILQLKIAKQQVPEKIENARTIDLWNLKTWIYIKESYIWN